MYQGFFILNLDRLKTFDEMAQEFGPVMDFLTNNKIINSIPEWWKTMLRQRIMGERAGSGFDILPLGRKLSKYVY